MNTGQRIASLRQSRKLSQKDLSQILGVSQAYVGQWENGTRVVPTEKVIALAEFFNVSTDYLLGTVSNHDKIDLKELLQASSMSFGGKEISEENLKALTRVISAFLEED